MASESPAVERRGKAGGSIVSAATTTSTTATSGAAAMPATSSLASAGRSFSISLGGSGGGGGGGGGSGSGSPALSSSPHRDRGLRTMLSRRWSLDNLSAAEPLDLREGYVRDLRRLHQSNLSSIRDEEYPFMLTEQHQDPSGKGVGHVAGKMEEGVGVRQAVVRPKSCVNPRIINPRNRSGSVDMVGFSSKTGKQGRQHQSKQSYQAVGGGFKFSSSVDISMVPEDNELPSPTPTTPPTPPHTQMSFLSEHRPASAIASFTTPSSSSKPAASTALEARNKAFLRQRSSSLPRILPPILDAETEGADGEKISYGGSDTNIGGPSLSSSATARLRTREQQQERQSNVVVREMQKFVCRHATNVSQILPLPIPSNARQGRSLRLVSSLKGPSSAAAPGPSGPASEQRRRQQCLMLMATIAKVHGIFFTVKQTAPALYAEFVSTLNLQERSRELTSCGILDSAFQQLRLAEDKSSDDHGPSATNGSRYDDVDKFRRQIRVLLSTAAAPPFSIIVHGDLSLQSVNFKTGTAGEPTSLKLPGLNKSIVGSPLLDILQVVYQVQASDLDVVQLLPELLQTYHSSFGRTCNYLRHDTSSCFTLQDLTRDIGEYFRPGLILVEIGNYRNKQSASPDSLATSHSLPVLSQTGMEMIAAAENEGLNLAKETGRKESNETKK